MGHFDSPARIAGIGRSASSAWKHCSQLPTSADIAALRSAAKLPTKNRLLGNHAINVATDRFLRDVALAPIGNLARNRLIDHAMAALVGNCQQCFQALEAERPIPAIAHAHTGRACHTK